MPLVLETLGKPSEDTEASFNRLSSQLQPVSLLMDIYRCCRSQFNAGLFVLSFY
jgi:hypothetical protein